MILFLDTIVFKDSENRLQFNTFVNLTNKNSYFHYTSHHTLQLRNNIPFGQFLRLHRNSSQVGDFHHDSERLSKQFVERGYLAGVVRRARALHVDWKTLFENRPAQQDDRIHCALQFNPHSYAISRIIKKHWHIVKHLLQCAVSPLIGFKKHAAFAI